MRLVNLVVCAAVVAGTGCSDTQAPEPFAAFDDTFDDGVIDATHWRFGGDVTEANGSLVVSREFTDDYIETAQTFSGDWIIELDVQLDAIVWNDMFHGISIRNAAGDGVSLGFSMYDRIYLGRHDSTSTSFAYGPTGSNRIGQRMRWTIENTGGAVSVLIDGQPVAGLPTGVVPSNVRITLPGYYTDGDGGAHVGLTTSDISYFSIAAK
jgi:hypothetical protein